MKKAIVITTINPPTKAVIKFAEKRGWKTIVVGDKKTPTDWDCPGVTFLPVQVELPYWIADKLPYNHYSRKMIGYLEALRWGAEYVAESDDDNVPDLDWGVPDFAGVFHTIQNKGFVNVYQYYTDKRIWPRGFPLDCINQSLEFNIQGKECRVGVWQSLIDGDSDVDAIYRLTINEPCFFETRMPVVLGKGVICPFNSQNTAFCREVAPLMYLPATVSFRFTDILRGYVAQPILWKFGYRLGFAPSTVTQHRNPHNYMEDFVQESTMYEYGGQVTELVREAIENKSDMLDCLYEAYRALALKRIVKVTELDILIAWFNDLSKL